MLLEHLDIRRLCFFLSSGVCSISDYTESDRRKDLIAERSMTLTIFIMLWTSVKLQFEMFSLSSVRSRFNCFGLRWLCVALTMQKGALWIFLGDLSAWHEFGLNRHRRTHERWLYSLERLLCLYHIRPRSERKCEPDVKNLGTLGVIQVGNSTSTSRRERH